MSSSKWLNEYYSRIIEEYKFSMERKDRVTDWAIGIFFVSLVAYAELLREQVPPIWRIYLIVGLLCFIMRLFINSCLAYSYLKKWRYLLDFIEKYWMNNETLESVTSAIDEYHYTPRTTEKRIYFVKHQLVGGFVLLFLFPFALLLFEIYPNPLDWNIAIPVSFLVVYFVYESVIFIRSKELSMPSKNAVPPVSNETEQVGRMERRRKHLDSLFGIALVLLGILSAAEFQYFLIKEEENTHPYVLKVFVLPFLVLIILWLVKELFSDMWRLDVKMLWTELCWDFLSFTLFYYLLAIYGGFQIGIVLSFLLSLAMIYAVTWAYRRASPVQEGDRSMYNYYKSAKWLLLRWVVIVGAYMLLVRIVLP